MFVVLDERMSGRQPDADAHPKEGLVRIEALISFCDLIECRLPLVRGMRNRLSVDKLSDRLSPCMTFVAVPCMTR